MNIDVREYLRINPISVHKLTLSDQDTDCFLFFPNQPNAVGYRAFTQRQLFKALIRSIFGELVEFDAQGNAHITDNPSATISDSQFSNFVRRVVVEEYMYGNDGRSGMEKAIQDLDFDLDNIILTLRRKGILDYAGAVELQSNNARKLNWTSGIGGPIYKNMSYADGQIWCKSTSSSMEGDGGADRVLAGDQTPGHNHPKTQAEAITQPFATHYNGGKLVGEFAVGLSQLVAQGDGSQYGADIGSGFDPVQASTTTDFTYPLYGQNILDWRSPDKKHNNVPPCLNIYVRFQQKSRAVEATRSVTSDEETTESYAEFMARVAASEQIVRESIAEAKYHSDLVGNLDAYTSARLTVHDYLLRVAMGAQGVPEIFRQTVQMLLDIFAEKTNAELSTEDATMQELLVPHLDGILMPRNEFIQWYIQKLEKLEEIAKKIALARELMEGVPPLNYIGRIVISTTDDTEQKVVANYGGKRWRRIENFLRGVNEDDTQNVIGRKWGEEYVELRQSNVPVHVHKAELTEKSTTYGQTWAAKDLPGSQGTMLLNSDDEGATTSLGAKNTESSYQISPLEYEKNNGTVTIPHDNMPPHLQVYVWECVELTDEEVAVTGEPVDSLCLVTWLWNNASEGRTDQQRTIGGNHSNIPKPTWNNHDFVGWLNMSGIVESNEQIESRAVTGNETYVAQWSQSKCTATFDANGGTPSQVQREYGIGSELGELPVPYFTGKNFGGWFTEDDYRITPSTTISRNTTYYAHWEEPVDPDAGLVTITWNANGGVPESQVWRRKAGIKLGSVPVATNTGQTLVGWYTTASGGQQVTKDTVTPTDSTTYYAHWNASRYDLVSYANGTSEDAKRAWPDIADAKFPNDQTAMHWDIVVQGQNFPAQPEPTATGYTFKNWYLSNTRTHFPDGSDLSDKTIDVDAPEGTTLKLWAQWKPNMYIVEFNGNGSTSGSMSGQNFTYGVYQNLRQNSFVRKYTVTFVYGNGILDEREVAESDFLGWAESASGERKYADMECVKNLRTTTDTKTLYAKWNPGYVQLPYRVENNLVVEGWYTAEVGGEKIGSPYDRYVPAADVTLYAHWDTSRIVTVVFDANGGSPASTTKTQARGTILEKPTVVRFAHTLMRWEPEVPATMPAQDTRYVAQWRINQYTATFDGNGGEPATTVKTQDYNTELTAATVTRAGHTFVQWNPTVPSMMPAEDTSYSAQWSVNQYTATFDANGGTGGCTKTQDYGTELWAPDVNRTGYTFIGWLPEVPSTMPDQDTTYVAQWEYNPTTAIPKIEGDQ